MGLKTLTLHRPSGEKETSFPRAARDHAEQDVMEMSERVAGRHPSAVYRPAGEADDLVVPGTTWTSAPPLRGNYWRAEFAEADTCAGEAVGCLCPECDERATDGWQGEKTTGFCHACDTSSCTATTARCLDEETIKPGTYTLRYDFNNPKPDRRANQRRLTSWRSWVVWPAGMVFIVEPDPGFPGVLRAYARGGFAMDGIRTDGSLTFGMLASALDPMQETPSDFLRRCAQYGAGETALRVLDKLNVPLTEIERLIAEIDSEEEGRG